jgi:hypothetical protein
MVKKKKTMTPIKKRLLNILRLEIKYEKSWIEDKRRKMKKSEWKKYRKLKKKSNNCFKMKIQNKTNHHHH